MKFSIFFCLATIAFSQSLEQRNAAIKEMAEQRNTAIKKMADEREAYFRDYMKSQWASFLKVPGVSLPDSPDLLDIKAIEIPKIKPDENPNIEIINALLKEGVNETRAINIALEIIDSLGIDAIREGQSIGIATEKNKKETPAVVSYKINSSENSTFLQSKTEEYKYVESEARKTGKNIHCIVNAGYAFPLKNPCRRTSGFGMREHPILGKQQRHNGVDYGAAKGSEVYAVAGGTVIESSFTEINGHYVALQHENGIQSYYLHLNEKGIEKGRKVETGQTIGKAGSTGRSTGPHLHLGIRKGGEWLDPEKVLGIKYGN
jgi:murein DD-endopeptidase MepM/ murein hydrolase activator NlpD